MQDINILPMNVHSRTAAPHVLRWVTFACFLSIISIFTMAIAHAESATEAQANYKKERAACMSGQTSEGRATCLREAGAAYADAKRGRLDADNKQYEQNALARCQALKGDDRGFCERRVHGEGTVTGSVSGGGELRELTVEVPVAPRSDGKPESN